MSDEPCTCDPAMYVLPSGQWVGANIECPLHGADDWCAICDEPHRPCDDLSRRIVLTDEADR